MILTFIIDEEEKKWEIDMIREAFKVCGHPQWNFRSVQERIEKNMEEKNKNRGMIVVPYVSVLTDTVARMK